MTEDQARPPRDTTTLDSHGVEWRDWVLTNVVAGVSLDELHSAMVEGGWLPAIARDALATASALVGGEYTEYPRPFLPPLGDIVIDGHKASVTFRSLLPAIAVCENILTPEECRDFIRIAEERSLSMSEVIDDEGGAAKPHPDRTSTGCVLKRGESEFARRIENRLAQLSQWPRENGEGLQILRYLPGQEYRAHYDAFSESASVQHHLDEGGQRVATIIVYLKSPDIGGGTSFPLAGIALCPKPGTAVMFHNVDAEGQCLKQSLHAGMPVEEGEKFILTYWQRERANIKK